MIVTAPAKVNLFLKIIGKRPDGYTEIETLFQTIDWNDRIGIEPDERLVVECDDARIPAQQNLGTLAAQLFFDRVPTRHQARIRIAKSIPIQAGLGGGSSDAAAVLRGLNILFGNPLGLGELLDLAGRLGSDVPFFVRGGTAAGKGRGERLTWLADLPPLPALLVHPACGVETAAAYRLAEPSLTVREGVGSMPVYEALSRGDVAGAASLMSNDLEKGVLARYPPVREAKSLLQDCGAVVALMSGSGSTCYGLFTGEAEALSARDTILRRHADWTVVSTSFSGHNTL